MVKEGECIAGATKSSYEDLTEKSAKHACMSDENWEEMNLKAVSMIQLCLTNELYKTMMDEETATRLWSRLEKLYMTKSLSNKLYLQKQLYRLRLKEQTTILEHLNLFNKVINELLAVDVNIDVWSKNSAK